MNSKKFAKLFETEKYGQIVVLNDTNDVGDPAINFMAEPPGLGVCTISLCFPDTDQGWDNCDAAFNDADEAMAIKAVAEMFKTAEKFSPEAH